MRIFKKNKRIKTLNSKNNKIVKLSNLIMFNCYIAYAIPFIKIKNLYNTFKKEFGFETSNLYKIKPKKLFNYYK